MQRFFLLMVIGTLLAGCQDGGERPSIEASDSSGVAIVSVSGPDDPLPWSFEEEQRLGGRPDGPKSFYRLPPAMVAADGQGNIYVLDAVASRMVMFDPAGRVIREAGGPGEGPGEFRAPGSMSVSPDGRAAIFDYARMSLVTFDSTGAVGPVAPFEFPAPAFSRLQPHFSHWGDGWLVVSGGLVRDDRARVLRAIEGSDTTKLATIPFSVSEMVRYPSCGADSTSLPSSPQSSSGLTPTGLWPSQLAQSIKSTCLRTGATPGACDAPSHRNPLAWSSRCRSWVRASASTLAAVPALSLLARWPRGVDLPNWCPRSSA